MNTLKASRVYRFRDNVALSISGQADGATVYLTPAQARMLANALRMVATDVRRVPFVESTCGTLTIEGGQ